MQNIEVRQGPKGVITIWVLFDNGSEVTLVRNDFCIQAGFKLQPATYTLAGVGGQAQTNSATNGGRLWSVLLQDNEGKTKVIEALGVSEILRHSWAWVIQGAYQEVPCCQP